MTDLLFLAGLFVLALVIGGFVRRARRNARQRALVDIAATRAAGYLQAVKDLYSDRAAEDAATAERVEDLVESRDWFRRQLLRCEDARSRTQAEAEHLTKQLAKYVGKESESTRLRIAYHNARDRARILTRSDVGQLRRMVSSLDKRLAEASFQSTAFTVPPTLQATAEELHAAFKQGLAPLVQRQADNDRIRELREAGDFEGACAYAEAVVDAQNQAANL